MKTYGIWDYLNLNIPLNGDGVSELESDSEDWKNVYTVHLEKEDYEELNDLFDQFNRRFDILIDFCEEEVLENRYIQEAIQMTEVYSVERPTAKESCKKLKAALEKGLETGYYVLFWL